MKKNRFNDNKKIQEKIIFKVLDAILKLPDNEFDTFLQKMLDEKKRRNEKCLK